MIKYTNSQKEQIIKQYELQIKMFKEKHPEICIFIGGKTFFINYKIYKNLKKSNLIISFIKSIKKIFNNE